MSTGLVINKASYGSASASPVDVTSAVSKKVKDGVLNFTVSPSALGIDDPAPGQLKTLEVDYTINGGKKNAVLKRDNDLVFIDAPTARVASGLQISKAEYGYTGNYTDVTNALQDLMKSDGSIDVKVGFKELGLPDPNPNKQKELQVEYTINGAQTINSFKDGERFRLSAPPAEDTSGPSLSDHTNTVGVTLFSGLFTFIGVFLQVTSGFATANFSDFLFGPSDAFWWIFFTIGLTIPLFAFVGLPFVAFFIRLFKSSNVVPA